MTSTTPAPGILTGPTPPYPNGIAIPGIAHLQITPAASDSEWIATDTGGQHHDGALTIGETLAHGPLRLHYATAADWHALAVAANRLAAWIEAS